MLNNKLFWYVGVMPGSILGWLFIVYGLFAPFDNETIKLIWLIITCVWVIGHPLELIQSIPIGKKAGLTTSTIIIKTMLFGITWRFPLKKGFIEK